MTGELIKIIDGDKLTSNAAYEVTNISKSGGDYRITGLLLQGFNDSDTSDESAGRSSPFCSVSFRFVWYTVLTGTLCLLGVIGNTVSIIILQKDKGNKVANLLLQSLAVADNALLVLSMFVLSFAWGSLSYFNAANILQTVEPYLRKYIHPIGYMTKTFAIYMTVLLAVNRYVAIKKPLHAQYLCTLWKARIQILAVVIFSVTCNVPRFFRYDMVRHDGNVTFEETTIGKGSLFHIIYTNVLYTVLVLILPLGILMVMNLSLVLELRRMRSQRRLMNVSSQPSDQNITLVMCIIIVIFIACHTPDRILEGISSFYKRDWWKYSCYLYAVCNLLIIFNSSSNFLVYFFVRKRFRRVFYETVCMARSRRPSFVPTTFISQVGDDSEVSGPLAALRKLSRSVADLLHRSSDVGKNPNSNLERNRARSLGVLLENEPAHRERRSQSAGKLMDTALGIVDNNVQFGQSLFVPSTATVAGDKTSQS